MNTRMLLLLYLHIAWASLVDSARILAMFPLPAKSHNNFFHPAMKALAHAGHEVVFYSPFPLDNPPPNYTNVILDMKLDRELLAGIIQDIQKIPSTKCIDVLLHPAIFEIFFPSFISDQKVKQLLQSNEKFDLVITESLSGQEYTLVLGQIFNAPVIILQAFVTNCLVNQRSGNTLSISHIPELCFSYTNKMTFQERLLNFFAIIRGLYVYDQYLKTVNKMLKTVFPDMPPLRDLLDNVSLTITNSHVTTDYAQPLTPNIIPVGGIHINEEKPLPQDIKKFMDDATEGVVLFSLGTYIPDYLQSKEYFDMYINVFKKLRQRVLWKTRMENIEGLPENVMTSKWMPQQDILAHPKCVLFITHCGLLSTHETVHFGVPVIGIPQFFDQHRNARYLEEQGVGIRLEKDHLSENTVYNSIQTVLSNIKYINNMKRLSRIFRDRPMTPAQTVVFWTEYVLRHGGAPHLKPASTLLSWYQLALLDVVAAIIAVFCTSVFVLYLAIRKMLNYVYATQIKTSKPSSKKVN